MKPALFVLLGAAVGLLWLAASVRRRLAQTTFTVLVELIEAVLWAYIIYVTTAFLLDPDALQSWSTFGRILLPVDGITGKQVVAIVLGASVGWFRFIERPFPQAPDRGEVIRGRRGENVTGNSTKSGVLERFRRFLHRLQQ